MSSNTTFESKISLLSTSTTITTKQHFKHKKVRFGVVCIYYIFDIDMYERKGTWVQDRLHFARRCEQINKTISYCFEPEHRKKIMDKFNINCE